MSVCLNPAAVRTDSCECVPVGVSFLGGKFVSGTLTASGISADGFNINRRMDLSLSFEGLMQNVFPNGGFPLGMERRAADTPIRTTGVTGKQVSAFFQESSATHVTENT